MNYRSLSSDEISILEKQDCSAESWKDIQVTGGFITDTIHRVRFSGSCKLGNLGGAIQSELRGRQRCGIYDSVLHNVMLDDNVFIRNVRHLANYHIESDVLIENVVDISVYEETSFGNGLEISVLNEGGGRELPVFDRLSAQLAFMMVAYRHDPEFIEKLTDLVRKYADTKKSSTGRIQKGSRIMNSNVLRNVWIGPQVYIEGVQALVEGTVMGEEGVRTSVGNDVIAKRFIVLSGSTLDTGTLIENTFVGQGVQLGKQFSAEHCAFFANSEGFHGEAVSIFAGPYTVSHHKSTLLIAGMFSFFNAGSGTNQSNHMYKLGPLHQGIVERGSKTGSFSYLLWPCKVGPFSVVMGKHGGNFDTSDLPFSYITLENEKTFLTPAMNLITVGTRRDSSKWPKRDRRKGENKLDLIHFDLFNPYVIEKVIHGIDILTDLYDKTPKEQETVNYKGVRIKRLMLKSCRKYYEMALHIFIGDQVVQKLDALERPLSSSAIRSAFQKDHHEEVSDWIDMTGLVAERSQVAKLVSLVREDASISLQAVEERFWELHRNYPSAKWAYALEILEKRYGIDPGKIKVEDLIDLVTKWKENGMRLNNMILSDARKEFDANSRIGFGLAGDAEERDEDFRNVRGEYNTNAFVQKLQEENEQIEKMNAQIIQQLEKLL